LNKLRLFIVSLAAGMILIPGSGFGADQQPVLNPPPVILRGIPFNVTLQNIPDSATVTLAGPALQVGGHDSLATVGSGSVDLEKLELTKTGHQRLNWTVNGTQYTRTVRVLPGFYSLIPPLLAILMALMTRQIIISLFAGVWIGLIFIKDFSVFPALLSFFDTYLVQTLTDTSHASIILFTLAFGGMVGVLAKNGGMQGIVEKISEYASTNRSGQLATAFMGVLIFFDDYANTLLVGNTMRVLTDKLRISREKLSYIVDSTAAPVTSMAIISTWVGFEMGLMQESLTMVGIKENIYLLFIETIPYRFYSLFAIFFVFLVAWTQRDFGLMLRAEKRSTHKGKVLRDGASPLADTEELSVPEGIPYRWYNAVIPIAVVIAVMMVGLYYSGLQALPAGGSRKLWTVIGESNSFQVLIWASFSGSIAAIVLSLVQRIHTLQEAIDAWLSGVKSMVLAVVVLMLAWSLSRVASEVQTAQYIIQVTEGVLQPAVMPALTFITAAVVSFATGTSWGTMAILIPIVIPLTAQLLASHGFHATTDAASFLATYGAVLSGSVFGDHCSPISDTTILSSMASGSDHIDHVRTQIPYAIVVGVIAIMTGYLPAGLHWNWPFFTSIGVALMIGWIFLIGKPIQAREDIDIS